MLRFFVKISLLCFFLYHKQHLCIKENSKLTTKYLFSGHFDSSPISTEYLFNIRLLSPSLFMVNPYFKYTQGS